VSPRPSAGSTIYGRSGKAVTDAGIKHLRRADPVMKSVIDTLGPLDVEARRRGRPTDSYGVLIRSIVGQQLSTKAARTIFERMIQLWGGKTPTPEQLLATDPEAIRGAGMSRPKVSYLRDLAERVLDGRLELDRLGKLSDEEISTELVAVKGIGQWSADMFLIFHLGRPDVLPVGDLGVRRAAQNVYALPEMPAPDALFEMGEPWRPYRSLASLYLWRSLDNEPA
jgi:DNA-3-methyladenine glycosylase II